MSVEGRSSPREDNPDTKMATEEPIVGTELQEATGTEPVNVTEQTETASNLIVDSEPPIDQIEQQDEQESELNPAQIEDTTDNFEQPAADEPAIDSGAVGSHEDETNKTNTNNTDNTNDTIEPNLEENVQLENGNELDVSSNPENVEDSTNNELPVSKENIEQSFPDEQTQQTEQTKPQADQSEQTDAQPLSDPSVQSEQFSQQDDPSNTSGLNTGEPKEDSLTKISHEELSALQGGQEGSEPVGFVLNEENVAEPTNNSGGENNAEVEGNDESSTINEVSESLAPPTVPETEDSAPIDARDAPESSEVAQAEEQPQAPESDVPVTREAPDIEMDNNVENQGEGPSTNEDLISKDLEVPADSDSEDELFDIPDAEENDDMDNIVDNFTDPSAVSLPKKESETENENEASHTNGSVEKEDIEMEDAVKDESAEVDAEAEAKAEADAEAAADAEEEAEANAELDEEAEADTLSNPIKQTHAIIIPSYASWFRMKKIHKIEKDSLPEFFTGNHPSKSPKIYANYRNFMMNSYRLNPNEYLTLTSCRRNLVGDVGTLMRVHRFLNKWGLINYQVNPSFKPGYAIEKLPNENSVGLPYTGDFHVTYDTPRGLFPFDTYKPTTDNIDIGKLRSFLKSGGETEEKRGEKRTGEDTEGQSKRQRDNWTSEEEDSLVKSIKEFKNDWYKIAKAVGNKTPQECVMKFLKLPIEDKYNEQLDKLGLLKYAPNFPISSVDNPVMSNLAFMTQLVDSEVAKAASLSARKVVDKQLIERINGADLNGHPKENDKEVNENKDGEAKEGEENGKDPKTEDNTEEIESCGAVASTFGIVGARSHLFASYEEREMNKLSATIVNQQLAKVDLKLEKVEEMEKNYELERQFLAKQQEELFIDRLALTQSTLKITKKLEEAVELLKAKESNEDLSSIISEVQGLVYKSARQSLVKSTVDIPEEDGKSGDSADQSEDVKPLSIDTPQAFKVWAP